MKKTLLTVLGTLLRAGRKEQAAMMRKMPNMKHAEPNMATLSKAGTVDFACLVPGHLEAGMMGKISVQGAKQ